MKYTIIVVQHSNYDALCNEHRKEHLLYFCMDFFSRTELWQHPGNWQLHSQDITALGQKETIVQRPILKPRLWTVSCRVLHNNSRGSRFIFCGKPKQLRYKSKTPSPEPRLRTSECHGTGRCSFPLGSLEIRKHIKFSSVTQSSKVNHKLLSPVKQTRTLKRWHLLYRQMHDYYTLFYYAVE